MSLYLGIYLHDLIVAVLAKAFIIMSIVCSWGAVSKYIFGEIMATQDSVQWVKEDVIAAVLHISPKWTIFDKPVMKVDFKSYVSQCSLYNFHIKFG